MKQKDLMLIGVIIFISAIISIFVSKTVFVSAGNRHQQVDTVQPISPALEMPSSRYFNGSSFDPTQSITIGQSNNTNPFNGSSTSQ
jgi:hypothetical protein